jgi:hypothetical protein
MVNNLSDHTDTAVFLNKDDVAVDFNIFARLRELLLAGLLLFLPLITFVYG